MTRSNSTVEKSDVSTDVSDGEFAVAVYSILSQDALVEVERIKNPNETDIEPRDSVRLPDRQVVSVLTVAYKTIYVWGRPEDGGRLQPFAFYLSEVDKVNTPPDYCVTEYPSE